MTDFNENVRERGNALVITLLLLIIVGGGVFFYLSQNGGLDMAKTGHDHSEHGENDEAKNAGDNPVVAIVDGKEIRRQEAIDTMNSVPPQLRQLPPDQLFAMVVDQMINNKVIDKKASKAGLERDKDVKEQLSKLKEQVIRTKFLENSLEENMDEARVRAEYDSYVEAYKPELEVRASHILVGEEKTAKDIVKKLDKGTPFEELAKENSLDGTAQNGGDLGFFTKGEVVPEFAESAFSLEPGKYTKKPVKSSYGYHIIRVDEKRERPADTYEQMKPIIEQNLRRVVYEEMLTKWRDGVEIKRFDVNGNPIEDVVPETEAGDGEDSSESGEEESDDLDGKAEDADKEKKQ